MHDRAAVIEDFSAAPESECESLGQRFRLAAFVVVAESFAARPQVLVLLVICVVLGLGTFLAVLFGLVTAPTDQTTGEPSGAILGAHTAVAAAPWPIP